MTDQEPVAIIGPGRVGSALGARLGNAGWPVFYGTRSPDRPAMQELVFRSGPDAALFTPAEAVRRATIILFAVPWLAARSVLESLGGLDGKILLDTTNPLRFENGMEFAVDVGHSAAELLQSWAPGATVVKGFNAVNCRIMANPTLVDGPVSIPLAGADQSAKYRVARLVEAAGFHPVDSGPLSNAHYIEKMAMFYLSFLFQDRPDAIEFYLRPRPNNHLLDRLR